ncbi:unnamed protein product [Penicillium palitans]
MPSLSLSNVSSFPPATNDVESKVTSRASQVEAAGVCYSHLPFKIPGAVVLSAPSISVLRQTSDDVYRQINSDTSYSNQFIVVLNISPPLQELLAGDRNPLEVPYRLTLDTQNRQAVIRVMPSKVHERVTQSFSSKLVAKLLDMGIDPDDYTLNGASRYDGRTCAKEADQSLTPLWDPYYHEEWPSLVIETGLSESEAHLRVDAHWWFSNSDYKVNTRSPERKVIMKLYTLGPTTPRFTRGLQAEVGRTLLSDPVLSQTVSPTVLRPHLAIKEIVVTSSDVQNAPLELEFESVMRRPPAPNTREGNITFTTEDLAACCRYVFLEA